MLNFENEGNLVAIIVNKDKDKNKNEKNYEDEANPRTHTVRYQ